MTAMFGADTRIDPTGVVTVFLHGEIDASVADAFRALLVAVGTGALILLLNLVDVTFIDAAGLGVLVSYGAELAAAGGRLQVGPRSYQVDRVLEHTGLAHGGPAFDVVSQPMM